MFGAMPIQCKPRFLRGDAVFLTDLVGPIKLSAE
jgi:hypothetical protein